MPAAPGRTRHLASAGSQSADTYVGDTASATCHFGYLICYCCVTWPPCYLTEAGCVTTLTSRLERHTCIQLLHPRWTGRIGRIVRTTADSVAGPEGRSRDH